MNHDTQTGTPRQKKIEVVAKDGTTILLTPKQKQYADLKAQQPARSLASIVREVYPNANPDTARQIAHRNEQNTNIALYNNEQVNDAKTYIHSVVNNENEKTRDRLSAATDVLDRATGKATQRIEQTTTGVQFTIDLSGAMLELDQQTEQ